MFQAHPVCRPQQAARVCNDDLTFESNITSKCILYLGQYVYSFSHYHWSGKNSYIWKVSTIGSWRDPSFTSMDSLERGEDDRSRTPSYMDHAEAGHLTKGITVTYLYLYMRNGTFSNPRVSWWKFLGCLNLKPFCTCCGCFLQVNFPRLRNLWVSVSIAKGSDKNCKSLTAQMPLVPDNLAADSQERFAWASCNVCDRVEPPCKVRCMIDGAKERSPLKAARRCIGMLDEEDQVRWYSYSIIFRMLGKLHYIIIFVIHYVSY